MFYKEHAKSYKGFMYWDTGVKYVLEGYKGPSFTYFFQLQDFVDELRQTKDALEIHNLKRSWNGKIIGE